MTSIEVWLRLAAIRGLRGECALQIAKKIIAGEATMDETSLNDEQKAQFFAVGHENIGHVMSWLEQPGRQILTPDHKLYPAQLRQIVHFPLLLYVAGDPAILSSTQLAIVGSRNCSYYGVHWGDFFTRMLSQSGLTITSGLARGIDRVAHCAALSEGGKTVAVLGSGFENIYPSQHRALAEEIQQSGGAVISEFPLEMQPFAYNFPRRNRIISGLSQGVLVIEASLRSGSLITARYALEQNRDVYALPGSLGQTESEGTHWLIQQGASLVTHPDNILEQLHQGLNWISFSPEETNDFADNADVPLPFAHVLANVGDEVTPVDIVAERTGQPVPAIIASLLELELAGWIAAVPGGYVRLRRACHVRRTNVLV